ncbi:outer membrane protein assembly factor BamA [Pseudoruegeria sp. SK021]|uniref:outer membrane protein assembly factor BamA n=1 Tax=Pseudoruegeria sp. SK021 TaxID=1933035 RepID=UPI000A231A2B|nr:outer membrane protein assembly factor BamA [Pseudoruegeria sp. SK021]OSP53638.1 outer membrane protein assembly factor BamA [Pseudoruegeria sp. SK021]
MSRQALYKRWLGLVGMGLLAVVMGFGSPSPLMAQSAVSAIEVRGNQRIETATILNYAGITSGEPLSAGQVNAAYQRILSSGLFESVEIGTSGSQLIIDVVEFPTINRINIEGNRRLDDDALTALLSSKPRGVYSPTVAEADARTIADAYRQAGRLAASVSPMIIPRNQNRVDLVFEIEEGGLVEIERIGFVGNRDFSDRRLRQVLSSKQAGIFRSVVGSDTFIEDRVQFDRQVLTDFYRSRGYADFQILSVTPEFSRERDAFFLTFNVQEGQKFKIAEVSVSTDIPGLDITPFYEALKMKPGQTYSPSRIEDSITRIENLTVQEGLDFVRAEPVITRNDRDLSLNVDFRMTLGPRIFVERIDIEGNQTTLDQVIRRQFTIVEGDPFNPGEIRQSAERIRALGFFGTADVTAREGTAPDRVIIDVNVEEKPTGSLSFGANYSISDGFGIAAGLRESNFLGRGQQLNFSVALGVDNADSIISLTEPALLGRNLSGTASVYYRSTNQFSSDFDTENLGMRFAVNFPISEYGRLSLDYEISENEISNVSDDSSILIQNDAGTVLTSSVGYRYSFDTRRRGLDPNSGVQAEFGQNFAGLGGDSHYVETTALLGAETKAYNEEIGLTAVLRGGVMTSLDGQDSLITERFRGGNVRGFDTNGIGPRDMTAENEDALGGNYAVSLALEADFPLGLPEEYGIRGGVFFDAGSIWGLDDTQGSDGPVDDSFHLRTVIGASLFWDTPIGPLRFDFTRALQKESYDETQNFNFTVSTRF